MRYSAADYVERIKELKEDIVDSIRERELGDLAISSIVALMQCATMEIKEAKSKENKE